MLSNRQDCETRIKTFGINEHYENLAKLPRTGWTMRDIPNPESVYDHQISTALLVTRRFREDVERLGINIALVQDIILIHDIAEGDKNVGDITPHCGISEEEKREKEERAARKILENHPTLLTLWLDYADKRTPEGRMAKEFDKLQALEQARFYEDTHNASGLFEEFYTGSVIKRSQIYTDFLLQYAVSLYENKPR